MDDAFKQNVALFYELLLNYIGQKTRVSIFKLKFIDLDKWLTANAAANTSVTPFKSTLVCKYDVETFPAQWLRMIEQCHEADAKAKQQQQQQQQQEAQKEQQKEKEQETDDVATPPAPEPAPKPPTATTTAAVEKDAQQQQQQQPQQTAVDQPKSLPSSPLVVHMPQPSTSRIYSSTVAVAAAATNPASTPTSSSATSAAAVVDVDVDVAVAVAACAAVEACDKSATDAANADELTPIKDRSHGRGSESSGDDNDMSTQSVRLRLAAFHYHLSITKYKIKTTYYLLISFHLYN